jgi:hypothetical protein
MHTKSIAAGGTGPSCPSHAPTSVTMVAVEPFPVDQMRASAPSIVGSDPSGKILKVIALAAIRWPRPPVAARER